MKNSIIEQLADIQAFIKESHCISGEVQFIQVYDIYADNKVLQSAMFRCHDDKRGIFYVSWHIQGNCVTPLPKLWDSV